MTYFPLFMCRIEDIFHDDAQFYQVYIINFLGGVRQTQKIGTNRDIASRGGVKISEKNRDVLYLPPLMDGRISKGGAVYSAHCPRTHILFTSIQSTIMKLLET